MVVLGVLGVFPEVQAGVRLQEAARLDRAERVLVRLEAQGTRPETAEPGQKDTPLPFRVQTSLEYLGRNRALGKGNRPTREVRRVSKAEAKIDFFRAEGQTMTVRLRPEEALLAAEVRPEGLVVASAGGPLTRSELDLVQAVGDPLTLPDLLPEKEVSEGDTWAVSNAGVKALSEYEAVASTTLEGTLASLDETEARISIQGEVRGEVRGGAGTMTFDGELVFDRKAGMVKTLRLKRKENRKAGHVESALDVESTLTVERTDLDVPEELADSTLKDVPEQIEPIRELILLDPPGGSYSLLHDRSWHLTMDDAQRTILRRLDHGELVGQCDLIVGPKVGKGRHQNLDQLLKDIQKALGENFGSVVGKGEVGGSADGGYRYKVAVEGKPQQAGTPLWYYYLVASPEGEQLLVVFSLTRALQEDFGDQDLRLIGSLKWVNSTQTK
jgi:hypothetical protein